MKFPTDFLEQDGVFVPAASAKDPDPRNDAASAQAQIEAALRSASDLSSASVELRDKIRNWPLRYHLSADRANLLRGLKLDPNARVLEVGAGCGAITRYLGEKVREVWALEANPGRARLCHLRCRDLPQVKVIAAKPCHLEVDEPFDIITLIGVLEHAGEFCKEEGDPFRAMLDLSVSLLRPGGRLVVAIENQLGVKYFCGCGEDHGDPRFSGLEGYPEESGVRTFGRVELLSRLCASGLEKVALILPFPDYKVPNTLINADYADAEGALRFGLVDWCRTPFEEYGADRRYLFDDHLVLAEFAKNGLLPDHANSFLVLAAKGQSTEAPPLRTPDWIARRYYATRHPSFCTMTELKLLQGQPVLAKSRLASGLKTPSETLRVPTGTILARSVPPMSSSSAPGAMADKLEHVLEPEAFVEGAESMSLAMVRALRKVRGAEEAFTALLYEWVGLFQREEGAAEDDDEFIRGEYLDCIPDNLLRVGRSGPWKYVDREWRWTEPVALDWVFYRGLLSFWSHHRLAVAGREARLFGSFERFVSRCFELMNSPLSAEEIEALRQKEEHFRRIVRHGKEAERPASSTPSDPPSPILEWMIPGRTVF